MVTSLELYLLTVVHNIDIFLNIIFGCCLVVAFCAFIVALNAYDTEPGFKVAKKAIIVALIVSVPMIFIPSKKDMIVIYAVPMVLQNEKVQQLPDVLLDYILDEFTVDEEKK